MELHLAEIFESVADLPSRCGLAPVVAAAFRAVRRCRTAAMGGHVARCENGHVVKAWYNACRNRSCPRCAFYRTAKWLERQAKTLLGCPHHHVIFTVPHELNVLWEHNYELLAELLFVCARQALFTLAADARYLGAQPGAIMALHTWGQQLFLHPHVHVLVTAGGIDALGRWVASPRRWFLPAEPLKRLFRGKLVAGLRQMSGRLRLPHGWGPDQIEALCRQLEHKRWNVQVRERYEDPTAVLNYLGRYLNGGPIGESRLLAFDGHSVSFRYKHYRGENSDGVPHKVMTLPTDVFARRVLQHVPPKGFHVVRGYGLYRRGGQTEGLRQKVRAELPVSPKLHQALTSRLAEELPPRERPSRCPECAATVHLVWYPRGGPHRLAA